MASSASSSSGSSAASASTVGAEAGVVQKTVSADAKDSCMWYGGDECGMPRSCYDCLNTAIQSDSCAIDPYGECVSMSEYDDFVSKRNYYVPNYKYFPSSNYTYCSADDARCTACKASWTGESYMSVDATYCTGEDGCVCISLCEVSDWDDAVLSMNDCGYSISGMSSTTTRVLVAAAVGISVAFLFFGIAYVVKRYVRSVEGNRFDAEGRAIPRSGADRRPPRNGPLLGLDGWKSMREKLIETERAEIQGGNTALGGQRGNEGATEAPVIIIEHGEGYRPMSPSVMAVSAVPAVSAPTADATAPPASTSTPARPTAQSI